MLDQVGNQNVGFLMPRLKYAPYLLFCSEKTELMPPTCFQFCIVWPPLVAVAVDDTPLLPSVTLLVAAVLQPFEDKKSYFVSFQVIS